MQQITIVLTMSKGVVIRKTLTKPAGKPVQLSLPPGAKMRVEVQGPTAGGLAQSMASEHKLVQKKVGADLVIEGEGEALVQVSNFYNTKDVAVSSMSWDYTEPQPLTTQTHKASPESKASVAASTDAKANVAQESNATTAEVATTAASASAAVAGSSGMSTGVLVLGAALGLGGGGGGGGGSAAGGSASTLVSGTITAGPVVASNNMLVEFFKADGTKITSATTTVDASGNYKANLGSYSGVVIIKVTSAGNGADFMDEATQTQMHLDATLLSVGSVAPGSASLHVNPLTTIAAQKAGLNASGSPLSSLIKAADVAAANAAVAKALGLSGDVTQWSAATSVDSSGVSATPNVVGAVLAAISGQTSRGVSQQSAIDDLVAHFGSDGTISAPQKNYPCDMLSIYTKTFAT